MSEAIVSKRFWFSQFAICFGGLAIFSIALSFFEFEYICVTMFCWTMLIVTSVVFAVRLAVSKVSLAHIFIVQLYIACFLSIAISHWPLRLKFAISRPALTRFVDTYESDGTNLPPQWIGLFYVKRVDTDRYDDCIWLITVDDPNGPRGLLYRQTARPLAGTKHVSHRFDDDDLPIHDPANSVHLNEWFGMSLENKWRYTDEC